MVTELNEAQFSEFIKQDGLVLVDCWAPWCGPCRRLGPVVDEIAQELAGKVAVAKLNVDDNQNVAMQYGIAAIPALLFFKNGVQQETLVGFRPKEDIIAYINSL